MKRGKYLCLRTTCVECATHIENTRENGDKHVLDYQNSHEKLIKTSTPTFTFLKCQLSWSTSNKISYKGIKS